MELDAGMRQKEKFYNWPNKLRKMQCTVNHRAHLRYQDICQVPRLSSQLLTTIHPVLPDHPIPGSLPMSPSNPQLFRLSRCGHQARAEL